MARHIAREIEITLRNVWEKHQFPIIFMGVQVIAVIGCAIEIIATR